MEETDRKRPREDTEDQSSLETPPPYGSQEYWEDRYRRQENTSKKAKEDEDQPDPFHAWYFNYKELAPLIVPLILGDVEEDGALDETSERTSKDHGDRLPTSEHSSFGANGEVNNVDAETDAEDSDIESSKSWKEEEGENELVEVEVDEDDEGPPCRIGLAKGGPIEILEVGCGDVPLGMDILSGILELGKLSKDTQVPPGNILKRVICIDYSLTVIEALKAKQKTSTKSTAAIPLDYECEDARKLPYESGRFHFILEKGTMDAMLSTPDVGAENCRAIVAEMARLVALRGVIMVISHINAHTEDGMEWLNTIVVPGLRKGSVSTKWIVEVHGSDVPDIPEDENEEDIFLGENTGPAVYIIHKSETVEGCSPSTDEDDLPSIALRFYSY